MVSIRCSRFCLTLFSCPEYVLMTYQRNMEVRCLSLARGMGSEEALDEEVEDRVEGAQVGRCDRDEDQGNGRGLDQGLTVGPLDALELGPARHDEAHDGPALPL